MSKPSRRTLVGSAAALPVLAVPTTLAVGHADDPIFVAIDDYRHENLARVLPTLAV